MKTRIFLLALLLIFPISSFAQWKTVSTVDPKTGKQVKVALIVSDSGHRFSIVRLKDGPIYGDLALPADGAETFGDRLPVCLLDDREIIDYGQEQGSAEIYNRATDNPYYKSTPTRFTFVLFHGQGYPVSGSLSDIMSGRSYTFSYWLESGTQKRVTFSLLGAKKAIEEMMGVTPPVIHEPPATPAPTRSPSQPTSSNSTPTVDDSAPLMLEAKRPLELEVTNPIVKLIKAPGLFGEKTMFRYFFMVRNNGQSPFRGQIEIKLVHKTNGTNATKRETFACDIESGSVAYNFFDAHTGPERFHGEFGIVGYEYEAKIEEAVVARGKFALTDKFENLSAY